jgi:hypothetical protein
VLTSHYVNADLLVELKSARPRVHRKATSIQSLEQKRSPFTEGQNIMSAELMTHTADGAAAHHRHQLRALLARANEVAAAAVEAGHAADGDGGASAGAGSSSRWAQTDLRLLAVTEQLLQLKQALLVDQALLNTSARRSLVEEEPPAADVVQCYAFVTQHLEKANITLRRVFAAIKQRKRQSGVGAVHVGRLPSTASTRGGGGGGGGGHEEEPVELAVKMAANALARSGASGQTQQQERVRDLVQLYTTMLLTVRACAQGIETPEDTALAMRDLLMETKSLTGSNTKLEEDVQLQLATLRSTWED